MINARMRDIPCFQFPNLVDIPNLRHAVFTRKGGVSGTPCESLNVGLNVGDAVENVTENRRRVADCLKADRLFFASQVHGTGVIPIGASSLPGERPVGDAMITDTPGKFMAIQVADCQPVLLFDPGKRAAAAVHSGWRGSVENVIAHTVTAMRDTYGCRPENILAGIGPSLGPCCAEFVHYREELPEAIWKYGDSRHRFDFWALSRDQLTAAGVLPGNIHTSGVCTRCRTDLFFSYRGEKRTGRFAAVIGMTP